MKSLHREVGRLEAKVQQKEFEIRSLEMENTLATHRNQDLRDEIGSLQAKLRRMEAEREGLLDQLKQAGQASVDQERVEEQLRSQLEKAQKTIKVQSDHIAAPREGAITRFTPKHSTPSRGVASQVQLQPPPSFELVRPSTPPKHKLTQSAAYHNQPTNFQQLSIRKQSSRPNPYEYEGDGPRRPSTTALSIPATHYSHDQASRRPSITPLPNLNPWEEDVPYGSLAVQCHNPYNSIQTSLMPALNQFFNVVETWAERYANVPDRDADVQIPPGLCAHLHKVTNPAFAMSLLSTSSTRFFAVTKLVLHECAEFAFRPVVVKGFRADFDTRIYNCRRRIYTGINFHERRELLTNSTRIVAEIIQEPRWDEFLSRTIQHKTNQTWQLLLPLFAPGVVREEAWSGLRSIWKEAMRIGILMMQKVSEFNVSFPAVGSSSHFLPATMVSRDPDYHEDPMTLARMNLSVKLAISPVVTETNFEGIGSMAPRTLCFAKVLLMK